MVLFLPLLKGEACCETAWQPRGKQSLKPASIMHLGFSNPARGAPGDGGVKLTRDPLCMSLYEGIKDII